jgi:hypothetical protein
MHCQISLKSLVNEIASASGNESGEGNKVISHVIYTLSDLTLLQTTSLTTDAKEFPLLFDTKSDMNLQKQFKFSQSSLPLSLSARIAKGVTLTLTDSRRFPYLII